MGRFCACTFTAEGALIRLNEVASIRYCLITGHERVALYGIGQRGAPGVVIDLAVTVLGVTAHAVSTCATKSRVVCSIGEGAEVAQISPQRLAFGERKGVGEA